MKHTFKETRIQWRAVFVALIIFAAVGVVVWNFRMDKAVKPSEVPVTGATNHNGQRTDAEWKKILTPEQYYVLRQQGTEIPFTGALEYETRPGTYYSVGCDKPIFRSETKYDSGTGWPSFYAPISSDSVVLRRDGTFGQTRTEVLDTCGSHLGHVFDDGPKPTGKRYCMNSVALRFVPDKKE